MTDQTASERFADAALHIVPLDLLLEILDQRQIKADMVRHYVGETADALQRFGFTSTSIRLRDALKEGDPTRIWKLLASAENCFVQWARAHDLPPYGTNAYFGALNAQYALLDFMAELMLWMQDLRSHLRAAGRADTLQSR